MTIPFARLWQTVGRLPFSLWLLAVLAFTLGHTVGVVKWRLLVNTGKGRMPFLSSFRCYFAGLFANIFLPSVNGGDIVRAGLAIKLNGEKEAVILGSLADRVFDACALALILLAGGLLLPDVLSVGASTVLIGVLVLLSGFLLCCGLLFVGPFYRRMPGPLSRSLSRFRDTIAQFGHKPGRAFIALGIALLVQLSFVLLAAMLAVQIGIDLSLSIWCLVWPMAKLSAMLPISLGGLGVREAALAVLLAQFDVGIADAVGLGLLWESVFLTTGGMGGLFYLLSRQHLSQRSEVPRPPHATPLNAHA